MKTTAYLKMLHHLCSHTVLMVSLLALAGCASQSVRFSAAIKNNDLAKAERIIASGMDPNEGIIEAAKNKRHEIVGLLLKRGANPNFDELAMEIVGPVETTDSGFFFYRVVRGPGKPALWYAIQNDDAEMVRILIEKGANVSQQYLIDSACAHGGGGYWNLCNQSTCAAYWAFSPSRLKERGFDPNQFGGIRQEPQSIIEFEGCKWTDSWIERNKFTVLELKSIIPAKFMESNFRCKAGPDVWFDIYLTQPKPEPGRWSHTACFIYMTMSFGEDVSYITTAAFKPENRQIAGSLELGSTAFINNHLLKDERNINGYVLANIRPQMAGRRISLLEFARVKGNSEILNIMSKTP
jgi:hypothetical protein